jgi:hypothetical protein
VPFITVMPDSSVFHAVEILRDRGLVAEVCEVGDVHDKIVVITSPRLDLLDYAPLAEMLMGAGALGLVMLDDRERLTAEDADHLIERITAMVDPTTRR